MIYTFYQFCTDNKIPHPAIENIKKVLGSWKKYGKQYYQECKKRKAECEDVFWQITGIDSSFIHLTKIGSVGGLKAASNMTPEQRRTRARKAVAAREAKKLLT